jgi:hypothetical protein
MTVSALESPCADCPHAARCRAEQLACTTFSRYLRGGAWQETQREPLAVTYRRLHRRTADRWHRLRAAARREKAAPRGKRPGGEVM